MNAYPLELSAELLEEAQAIAARNQVSLSQWLTSAIHEAIDSEKARQALERYAKNVDYEKLDAMLARVPDVPSIEGDELLS